jgi:hypothetical protein
MPFFHSINNANITGGVFNDIKGDQNNYYSTADAENGMENEATATVSPRLIFAVHSSRGFAP